jgi:O-antigen/teichoic acid export membrane protein
MLEMSESTIKESSWAKTTTWLLLANVSRNIGLIVVLILLARLTNQEVVGQYALALAITTPIFALLQLGIKGIYLTLIGQYGFGSFLRVLLGAMTLAVLVSVSVAVIVAPALVAAVLFVSFIKVNDALCELLSGPMQRYHQPSRIFWTYLVSASIGSIGVAGTLVLGGELELTLAVLATTSLLVTVFVMWNPATRLAHLHAPQGQTDVRHTGSGASTIIRAGIPTGVSAAILSLVVTIPQYQLAAGLGPEAVGYLAVVLYGLAIMDIFLGTLTQAWIPKAQAALFLDVDDARHFTPFVLRASLRWTLAMVPLASLGVGLMSLFVPVVLGHQYALTWAVTIPLVVAIVLSPTQHFTGVGLIVKNYYNRNVIPSLAAVIASSVAGLILIPIYGVPGALWAVAFALAIRGITTIIILMKSKKKISKNS